MYVAGKDVTDYVIGDGIAVRSSTDYPYFSDSEVGDVVFSLENTSGDFDPLKPTNFFERNGSRTGTLGNKWDRTGYKIPVVITSNSQILFVGHIIDINIDVSRSKVIVTANDISNEYRDKEIDTSEFGIERFITADEGEQAGEYPLPETAAPIQPETVQVRYKVGVDSKLAPQATSLHTEGEYALHEYTVHPDDPSVIAHVAFPDVPNVRYFEPYRWHRIDRLVENLVDLIDPNLKRTIEIPEFSLGTREFITHGRVGWHIEGGEAIEMASRWGYRGYVRDFVVNPANGDVFFLYGGGYADDEAQRQQVIHYIKKEDRFANYQMQAYNVRDTANGLGGTTMFEKSISNPDSHIRQSMWRIATLDFESFYILTATGYNNEELTAYNPNLSDNLEQHGARLYEWGQHSNSNSGSVSQLSALEKRKPKIFRWVRSTDKWTLVDWAGNYGNALVQGTHGAGNFPQLANFIGLTDNIAGTTTLIDELRNPENLRPDTRNGFSMAKANDSEGNPRDWLIYKVVNPLTTENVKLIQYNTTNSQQMIETNPIAKSLCNRGWGYDFGHTATHIYIIVVNHTAEPLQSTMKLYRVNVGSSTVVTLKEHVEAHTSTDDASRNKWWNVSDITITTLSNEVQIYGVLQYGDHIFTQGRLFRMRSDNDWAMETVGKDYQHYVHGAKGGCVFKTHAYFYEGSVYPQIAKYQSVNTLYDSLVNPTKLDIPQTGRLVSIASDGTLTTVDRGLVWRSAVLPREWYDDPNSKEDYILKAYGAHNAMIAPLRADADAIHLIAGYGDVQSSINSTPSVDTGDDLIEFPADNINNWQWLQWSTKYPLRLDKIEIADKERVWDYLKMIAELTLCTVGIDSQGLSFKSQPGIYTKTSGDIDTTIETISLVDTSLFPSSGLALIGNELIRYTGKTETSIGGSGTVRGEYPTAAAAHASGEYAYVIDSVVDNYSANQKIMSIDLDGKYEEIYNQIKGRLRYTIENSVAPAEQEYTVQDDDLVDLISEKPFDINTEPLSHHQLWWRDLIAKHYLNEFKELSYDINLDLTWTPELKEGHTIAIDIKHPARDGTTWAWRSGNVEWIPARVVELIQNIGLGDSSFTTHAVVRTLPFD